MKTPLLGAAGRKKPVTPPPAYGDTTAGFYGQRAEEDVISASALASAVGLNIGVVVTDVKPSWLKFALDGKEVFLATRAFRHSITWDQLYNKGLCFDVLGTQGKPTAVNLLAQNAQVTIKGIRYRVRNMTIDEWNRLVVPLREWSPGTLSLMNIGNVPAGARWMLNYVNNVNARAWRGWTSLTTAGSNPSNTGGSSMGWSPMLEPI
jgi:hypothetical protein